MFWRNVNVLYIFAARGHEFASLARCVALVNDIALLVQFDVGLSNDVLILFPRRQVERERLRLGLAPVRAHALVCFFNLVLRNMIARLELRVASVNDAHVFDYVAVLNFAVRRLYEAELVDARKA